jgi:hypothetical protein
VNLAALVDGMRAIGIKTLTLELEDGLRLPPEQVRASGDTEPPSSDEPFVETEFAANPNVCAATGCGEPSGGILGGKMAGYCRKHALGKMGIK